jgi:hypothetical protein
MAATARMAVAGARSAGPPSAPADRVTLRMVLGVVALLASAGATALGALRRWPLAAVGLWWGSMAAASLAARGLVIAPASNVERSWSRREIGTVLLVLALAGVARFAWIGSLPRYYFADEARVAMFLVEAYRDTLPNFFSMGWNTWPVVGLSWQGLFAPLVGLDIATLRLSSALMGTLAVLATYLLARELYTPRVALLAAVLLSLCRTAIDFSRLGTCHAQVIFLEPLAFFCWWRAVARGTALGYLWAGIAMGLCLYSYNAGQSVPLLWAGWLLTCAALAWRRARGYWRGALLTAAGLLLTFAPYLWHVTDGFHFDQNWREWTIMARERQVMSRVVETWNERGAAAATAVIRQQVAETWMGYHLLPAGAYGLGYRGGGMLDGVTGPLFILGLAACLANVFQPASGFVFYWWLATTLTGGVLTRDPPAFVRLVGVLPAVAILAALPLDQLMDAARGRWRSVGLVTAGLLLAGASWDNWRTYFVEFARAEVDLASDLARRLEALPRATSVFLLGSEYAWRARGWQANQLYFNQELFLVNFRGSRLVDVAEPGDVLPLREAPTTPLALVLGPTQVSLADYVRSLYPHTRVTDVVREEGLAYRLLELDPDDLVARAGLSRVEGDPGHTAPTVADPFQSIAPDIGSDQQRHWSGRVYWPTDQPVTLAVQTSGPATIEVGGVPVGRADGPRRVDVPLQLSRGWQPIVIDEPMVVAHSLALTINDRGRLRDLSRWDLRPEAGPEGLAATYERDGTPLLHSIDSQLNVVSDERLFQPPNPLPARMPFAVTWRGSLRITDPGTYRFEVHATGPFVLRLDGAAVLERKRPPSMEPAVAYADRVLSAGTHPIDVRWDCTQCSNPWRRVFQLYWKPPGGQRELVPPTHFVPEAAAPQNRSPGEPADLPGGVSAP